MNISFPKKYELENFFKKKNLKFILNLSKKKINLKDSRVNPLPHLPNLKDLYNLYNLITLNNRTTVLEYGCGWSTLIMHFALMENYKKNQGKYFKRSDRPFNLISVDNSKKFIKIAKTRIQKNSKNFKKVKFVFSKASMTKFNGRYCTEYNNHPLVNPDFIYIDGPSQWTIKNKIESFTVNHFSMMPMMCDVLKFEHFLNPGTIIVVDGRTANVRFLKSNFQRKWKHYHKENMDQHYFLLDESPLGKHNLEQIRYYKFKI